MKKLLIPIITLSLAGCGAMSGFVNQERIVYKDDSGSPVKSELVTYVTKVDEILKVYDKESTSEVGLDLDAEDLAAKLKVDITTAEKLVKFAADLDQVNSQNYPILFTIFLGLNANPSSSENREKFWNSLSLLINRTYDTRDKEIALRDKTGVHLPQPEAKK